MTTFQAMITRGLLLIAALAAPQFTAAQEAKAPADAKKALPKTRAGEIAGAYITAFNSGSDDTYQSFEQTHRAESALKTRPIPQRLSMVADLREQWGRLTFRDALESRDGVLSILVDASQSGEMLSLTFELEPAAPNKLVGIRIQPVASAAEFRATYDDYTDLADLASRIRKNRIAPAVAMAVARGGKVVDQAVVGTRQADTDSAVRPDDHFHVGSVAKSITASAIGRLIEAGRLDWNITLEKALPDVKMRDEYKKVTLRQLLCHRAGVPQHMNFDGPTMQRLISLPGTPTEQRAAYAAEVLNEEPIAEPGTQMRYSNAGYAIAGLVAERATGKSWEDLIRQEVFVPLEMKQSGFGWPASPSNPDQPRGHYVRGDGRTPQELDQYNMGHYLSPAGNIHCSIGDLARYAAAHVKGLRGEDGWMKSATIKALHEAYDGPGEKYASGWMVQPTPDGKRLSWHNGSAGTFYCSVLLYPDSDLAVVFATNMGAESLDPTVLKAADAIRRKMERK